MYDAAAAAHANTPQTARISRHGREGISYPLMSASRAQAPVSNVRFGSESDYRRTVANRPRAVTRIMFHPVPDVSKRTGTLSNQQSSRRGTAGLKGFGDHRTACKARTPD